MRLLVAAVVVVGILVLVMVGRRKEDDVCARKAKVVVAPLLLAEAVAMHVREYNMNVDMAMDNQVTADAAPTLMPDARLPLVWLGLEVCVIFVVSSCERV